MGWMRCVQASAIQHGDAGVMVEKPVEHVIETQRVKRGRSLREGEAVGELRAGIGHEERSWKC